LRRAICLGLLLIGASQASNGKNKVQRKKQPKKQPEVQTTGYDKCKFVKDKVYKREIMNSDANSDFLIDFKPAQDMSPAGYCVGYKVPNPKPYSRSHHPMSRAKRSAGSNGTGNSNHSNQTGPRNGKTPKSPKTTGKRRGSKGNTPKSPKTTGKRRGSKGNNKTGSEKNNRRNERKAKEEEGKLKRSKDLKTDTVKKNKRSRTNGADKQAAEKKAKQAVGDALKNIANALERALKKMDKPSETDDALDNFMEAIRLLSRMMSTIKNIPGKVSSHMANRFKRILKLLQDERLLAALESDGKRKSGLQGSTKQRDERELAALDSCKRKLKEAVAKAVTYLEGKTFEKFFNKLDEILTMIKKQIRAQKARNQAKAEEKAKAEAERKKAKAEKKRKQAKAEKKRLQDEYAALAKSCKVTLDTATVANANSAVLKKKTEARFGTK